MASARARRSGGLSTGESRSLAFSRFFTGTRIMSLSGARGRRRDTFEDGGGEGGLVVRGLHHGLSAVNVQTSFTQRLRRVGVSFIDEQNVQEIFVGLGHTGSGDGELLGSHQGPGRAG